MNHLITFRLYYTRLFLAALFSLAILTVGLSLPTNPEQFEKNIWKHDALISGFTRLRWALGDHVYSSAVLGKDGWLEYSKNGNLDDYQNANPASVEDLEKIRQKIRKVYQLLRQRNITFLIVIAPNKATIYPDKLSDEIQKLGPESYLDKLTGYLKQKGPAVLLDLRPTLQAGRKKQDVYYRTDTHWNSNGAFVAYANIIRVLSNTYPQLQPKKRSEFKVQTDPVYLHDIAQLISATNILEPKSEYILKHDNVQWGESITNNYIVLMQVATTSNPNAPSLLMYGDSFSIALRKLLAPHFSKTTFIQNSPLNLKRFSMKEVDTIKPNILIIEFVERSVYTGYLDQLLSLLLESSTN